MAVIIINDQDIYLTAKQADILTEAYKHSLYRHEYTFEQWYKSLDKNRNSKLWLKGILKEYA